VIKRAGADSFGVDRDVSAHVMFSHQMVYMWNVSGLTWERLLQGIIAAHIDVHRRQLVTGFL
jgi:hypothetical protein